MKAIQIQQYGAPSVLQITDIPTPNCKPDEVLVKVKAASVNPIDWKVREGHYAEVFKYKLPLVIGWDMSGIIESVGADVTDFKVGDEVFGLVGFPSAGNCYAEQVAVKASEISFKPEKMDFIHASACPLVTLTAWQCLFEVGQLKKDEKVLIHAGAGGVGHVAIQLAKSKGAFVYTTCSEVNKSFVDLLGADVIIDYKNEDFREQCKNIDLVFDTVGSDITMQSLSTLKKGGRLVSIASQISPEMQQFADDHELFVSWELVYPSKIQLQSIAQLIDDGALKIQVSESMPYTEVIAAHEKIAAGHGQGKRVLVF